LNNKTLQALDTIRGAMGRCYMTVDGNREEMLYTRNVEANAEKEKIALRVMGTLTTKHRSGGWTGTGSMNIYYATSVFRRMMYKYAKTGVDTYFDMVLENNDEGSNIGRQVIMLKRVNIDSVVLFNVDTETEVLDEDVNFTFEDFEILEDFQPVVGE